MPVPSCDWRPIVSALTVIGATVRDSAYSLPGPVRVLVQTGLLRPASACRSFRVAFDAFSDTPLLRGAYQESVAWRFSPRTWTGADYAGLLSDSLDPARGNPGHNHQVAVCSVEMSPPTPVSPMRPYTRWRDTRV